MSSARVSVALALALATSASFAQLGPLPSDTLGPSTRAVGSASYALTVDRDMGLGGKIFKDGAPFLHSDGGPSYYNTAVGRDALISLTPGVPYASSGNSNTAFGADALKQTTTGSFNTAEGVFALWSNTEGVYNTANGALALAFNTTGASNVANGSHSLVQNQTGQQNTAIGRSAMYFNTTGSRNTAVGKSAGANNSTGSDNIWIAHPGETESNTLRVGNGTGTGPFQVNRAFIAGIRNVVLPSGNEQSVCTDGGGQIGMCSPSSARFKEDVAELAGESEGLFALRPVRFRYKKGIAGGAERPVQYGLIAEEVAAVFPQLVAYDDEGRPLTVRYEALTPLLLNELKKERERIVRQESEIARQRAEIEELAALAEKVREQEARLTRLESRESELDQAALVARR